MSNNETVTVTLTRRQAEMVWEACESFCRMRMGQFFDYANDIADSAYPNCFNNKEDFDKMIKLRNDYYDVLNETYPTECRFTPIPEKALVAETVWLGIRSALSWHDYPEGNPMSVYFDPPRSRCNEPIPKVVIE